MIPTHVCTWWVPRSARTIRGRSPGSRQARRQQMPWTCQVRSRNRSSLLISAAADVFVCASEHEGFCVPLVEAMGKGIPVVAYDAAAVGETVGGAGLLVSDKSPARIRRNSEQGGHR